MPQEKKIYGLIGKNISYSFSKKYFTQKFKKIKLTNCEYNNFDISSLDEFDILKKDSLIRGLNVTIPYKEKIIPRLDSLDLEAEKIGAVNTIKIDSNNKLKGYNTDYLGFLNSIKKYVKKDHKKAILLGGSSLKNFSNTEGQNGNFQQKFNVYGKEKVSCMRPKCLGFIRKIYISNRSSFFCTKCQK